VVEAVNASLAHLVPWMAWASEPATEAGMAVFLAGGEDLWDQRRDFNVHIIEGPAERVIGGAGLHGRQGPDALDIGYWLRADSTGQGVATELARALTSAAFDIDGVARVRIQCDERNVRSALVPERLGFELAGTSQPDATHPDRLVTLDWVMARQAWIATRAGERS
jgi:RimJ/RimL family protein N-acetyltransferase